MISYFIPHKNGANRQHLVDAGLEMLLREGDESPRFGDLAGTGPGELPGQIVSWSEDVFYLPDKQDWTPALPDPKRGLKAGRYWIGTLKGQKPTPAELARKESVAYDGIGMILGDGNAWVIPNALAFPHYLGLNPEGELDRFPVQDCMPVYERTLWALEHAQKFIQGEAELDSKAAFVYVTEMLAVNYRICPQLVSSLQLFNEQNLFVALCNTTDVDRLLKIREELKKNSIA